MNKAKKMLDALMGPSRDISAKDKANDDFKEKNCCKHYLVGCCPDAMLGKKMEAIRQDPATHCICPGVQFDRASILNPEGCSKLHSSGLRIQLNEHPEAAKYRREYEDDLRKFLANIVSEAEKKGLHERKKREELGRAPDNEKMCEICGMRYKLKKKEYGIEVEDHHPDTDVHKVYVKLRAKLEELEAKHKEDQAKEEEEKAKEPKSSEAPRDKSGERDEKKSKSKERAKDRSKDRSRSPKERKSREGEEKKERKSRERDEKRGGSRDGGRGDRKSDDRERRRSESRHGRDRGRGRDDESERRGGRNSSRDRARGRGSDRDRDRNRDDGRSDRRRGRD